MLRMTLPIALIAATPLFGAAHDGMMSGQGDVQGTDGENMGVVTVEGTASGNALVTISLTGVPEGTHGVHLHEAGDCSAADFSSAGGHIPGDKTHGIMSENGPHPGDLPNVVVGPDGVVEVAAFAIGLDLQKMIFDEDGAAFIVHSEPDDYTSQPSGDAGDRIACGVVEATSG